MVASTAAERAGAKQLQKGLDASLPHLQEHPRLAERENGEPELASSLGCAITISDGDPDHCEHDQRQRALLPHVAGVIEDRVKQLLLPPPPERRRAWRAQPGSLRRALPGTSPCLPL